MKTNVNLFIALILCAVIGGALYFLARPSQESLGWNPDEMYGDLSRSAYDGSAFTNATFSGSSNAGGVALSMQGGSLSSRTRAKSSRPITIQYPIANSPSPIANHQSPIANGPSPIAYMTSGAEYRSFGGGGNGNMGTAGTFRANTQSPITNSQLPISNLSSPIAYNPSPISNSQLPIANHPSPISNSQLPIANHPSPIANSQLPIANNPSTMFGYELKTTFGTASYETYSMLPTRNNVRGKQMLGAVEDTWLNWLALWGQQYGKYDDTTGTWYYDQYDLRKAYDAFCATWNETMGKKPTWEEWLSWFMASETDGFKWSDGTNEWTYHFLPVGGIYPLLLIALLYMIILFVKRNKTAQL